MNSYRFVMIFTSSLCLFCLSFSPLMADKPTISDITAFETSLFALQQDPNTKDPKAQTLTERMSAYHVPGVSIAVIKDFQLVWSKGYGLIRADKLRNVSDETMFEAASTTKMLVAATVMRWVEKGKLDLDADVNTYLKSWKIPDNDFTKEKKVTLRLLLSHRAGLAFGNMGFDEKAGFPTLVQVVKGEAPAQNKPAIPVLVPGSKWQYSNVGYALIQLILEESLGQPLEQIMNETFFEALSMKKSTFVYPLPAFKAVDEALPHNEKGEPCEAAMHPTAMGQGGLMTTPGELSTFLIEMMKAYHGHSSLLSQASTQAMFKTEAELDPRMFGTPINEGLGVFVKGSGQNLIVAHPGNNFPGSVCWLIGFPQQGNGAAIMINGAGGEMLAIEIIFALTRLYNWPSFMS